MQRLSKGNQKTTPFYYYVGSYQKTNGINKRVFSIELISGTNKPVVRLCNYSTYGGNEYQNNGVYVVDDTATVVCWYDPAITAGGAISLCDDPTGAIYEILGQPENIEQRNQEMTFKVRRFKGGA